jgi:general secretion pathway protein D
VGILLDVIPHINPDGLVIMDVSPEISARTNAKEEISDNLRATVFSKRSAQTRVSIQDGQTIVIGGLMEDRRTADTQKVPLLGDIPLIGSLFRRDITAVRKTELLIFLTPHVASRPDFLKPMSKDELEGARIVPNAVAPGVFQQQMEGMRRGSATQPVGPYVEPGLKSDKKVKE